VQQVPSSPALRARSVLRANWPPTCLTPERLPFVRPFHFVFNLPLLKQCSVLSSLIDSCRPYNDERRFVDEAVCGFFGKIRHSM
ncbi:MAG: hypothetical protein JXA30_04510, partial [Deltaproteobacteria bacterium]|nr:hypothetical protein [Deltaproteobacteria bacterium]